MSSFCTFIDVDISLNFGIQKIIKSYKSTGQLGLPKM